MLLIGGFVLTYPQAKAWALRHYLDPPIDFYNPDAISYIIEKHQNTIEPEFEIATACVIKSEIALCVFVTHLCEEPTATFDSFPRFKQDEYCREYRKKMFGGCEEDFGNARFATIVDPQNRGY